MPILWTPPRSTAMGPDVTSSTFLSLPICHSDAKSGWVALNEGLRDRILTSCLDIFA